MNDTDAASQKLSPEHQEYALLLLVLVSTFIVYVGTATFGFVYDDVFQILGNPAIRSWNVLQSFTSPVVSTPYYRPLFTLWLRLNYVLFGQQAGGWHITSALLHVIATALVFFVARRLDGRPRVALFVALIFGLHPIHVESVVWISGSCDPMFSIFFLASFLAYLKARESGTAKWRFLALLLCACALLSKEPAIAFPAIVCCYEYFFGQGDRRSRFLAGARAALPFAAMVLVYVVVRFSVTSGRQFPASVSSSVALLTVPRLLCTYAVKLIWPTGLSAFYNPIYVDGVGLTTFVIPGLVIAAIVGAVWIWSRASVNGCVIAFAAFWALLLLAPALFVRVFPYGEAVHDRYLYLPCAGFALLVAVAARKATERLRSHTPIYGVVAVVVAIPLAAVSVSQQVYWASDLALYRRGADIAPQNSIARNNLGRAIADAGRFDEAEPILTNLVKTAPGNWQAHYNLGYVYYRTNRFPQAEIEFARAEHIYAGYADVHLYRGLAQFRMGDLDNADREVRQSMALAPERPGSHLALSLILESKGDLKGALAEVREENRHGGDNPAVRAREEQLAARLGTTGK